MYYKKIICLFDLWFIFKNWILWPCMSEILKKISLVSKESVGTSTYICLQIPGVLSVQPNLCYYWTISTPAKSKNLEVFSEKIP